MSLSWIRVNAALLDDKEVRAFGVELMPKFEAWAARAAGAGLLVALWGKVAEHQPDGCVAGRDDEQLEEWAQWKGKPVAFAAAFRARFTDDGGHIAQWEEYQGAALARREADKVRKVRTRVRAPSAPRHADRPVERPRDVTRTPLRTSRRNGDGTETEQQSGTTDLSAKRTLSTIAVEKPEEQPAVVTAAPATASGLSSVVTRFMARFYATATPDRRRDVARQMTERILSTGVTYQGSVVRAVDADHLDDACLEVMEEPPRDANAAWVFVLAKLRDTYLEVLSSRMKALESPRPANLPPELGGNAPAGATPLRAALAGVLDGLDVPEADA